MKFLLTSVVLVMTLVQMVQAQKPEHIYGKNRILKSNDYYLEQMELWEKETKKDPKNANAWYNYYRSSRNAYIVGEENDSLNTKGINRFERLNNIVAQMEKRVPKSYEYHYIKWLNGNNDLSLFPYLEKAHELAPQQPEPVMSLIYYYEITCDSVRRNQCIHDFYVLGDYSAGMLNYGYNLIIGLDQNAFIFTEGDKDTDAILILQQGMGIRKDLKMLNLNLLLIPDYRERVFSEFGIAPLDYNPLENDACFERYRTSIVNHVAQNNQQRPVYTAATVSAPYTETIRDHLYIEGLASRYSNHIYDNLAILEKNYEYLYAMDYIHTRFAKDLSEGWVLNFNQHYLESMALLHNHFLSAGNVAKAQFYWSLGSKIAIDSERSDLFDRYFNGGQ
jgi:hypothetical protein